MKKYVILDFTTSQTIEIVKENEFPILLLIIFVILHYISYRKVNLPEKISKLGLIIIITPKNPKAIALHLLQPNFSPKKGTESPATING